MLLFTLAFVAGALTLLAPCILPILPFVFARAGQPFVRHGLPLLAGLVAAFAAVGTLAAVAGNWAVDVNRYGRLGAMALLAALGLALLVPQLGRRLGHPMAAVGARLLGAVPASSRWGPEGPAFLTGVATGLLWAPCAGPVLGLVLAGAAFEGPSLRTTLLLAAYAGGAATSLALALLAGRRVLGILKRSFGIGEGMRKLAGAGVLAGVAVMASGLDARLLPPASPGAAAIEEGALRWLAPQGGGVPRAEPGALAAPALVRTQATPALVLPVEGRMPPLAGAVQWLNSAPLSAQDLRGKVVLVDFWTFGCINCRNALPYVREWHRKYKDQGLVVVGVHTPEFAYEKDLANVRKAVSDLNVGFPVAVDNNFAIWRAFNNRYWPAHYFVDAAGNIRFHHFGEGEYEKSEQVLRQLLDEARRGAKPGA
jgi:cytochrome c biogenesis protein CcdA/thiol-disulfide isomerase/thioredoxin